MFSGKKGISYSFVVAFLVVVVDQVTKFLVKTNMPLYSQKVIIPKLLNLVHIKNKGIAFGIFNGAGGIDPYILTSVTVIAIFFIVYLIFTEGKKSLITSISLGLILGGAIGNLIDRILFKQVTDFIDLYMGKYHWPAFNISDSAISIGGLLILFSIFKGKKDASSSD
ncbi:signal peptidase II [Desulfothermus okinawensis JCM 13304]